MLAALLGLVAAAAVLVACASKPEPAPNAVKTGFERRGGTAWTSLREEESFLRALDAASDRVTVTQIGRSVRGRPIRLLVLGPPRSQREIAGGPSVLFVCTQHGNEPAGREACLEGARDYAAGTDGATVLVIPTANPDGVAAGERLNARGADINRDHLLLRTPEARAIAKVLRDYRPDVLADLHEYRTPGARVVELSDPRKTHPNTDPAVSRLAAALNLRYVAPALRRARFAVGDYSQAGTDPAVLRQMAGLRQAVALLVETPRSGRLSARQRVRAQRIAWNAVLAMARARSGELASVTSGAARRAAASGASPRGRYWFSSAAFTARPPCGFSLAPAQYRAAEGVLALQGIRADAAGGAWTVPLSQAAEPVIGLLLDPRSPYRVVAGQPQPC